MIKIVINRDNGIKKELILSQDLEDCYLSGELIPNHKNTQDVNNY